MNARAYYTRYVMNGRAPIQRRRYSRDGVSLRRWWLADMQGHLVLCFHSPNPDSGDPILFIAEDTEMPESIGQHSDIPACRCTFCTGCDTV